MWPSACTDGTLAPVFPAGRCGWTEDERPPELLATGAQRVATACPFSYIIRDDAVKGVRGYDVIVEDFSMHLMKPLQNATTNAPPPLSIGISRREGGTGTEVPGGSSYVEHAALYCAYVFRDRGHDVVRLGVDLDAILSNDQAR